MILSKTYKHTAIPIHVTRKKKQNKCRFDFPRPVSQKTQIQITNISHTTGRFYELQRTEKSIWINPYNPAILSKWNANMDIQVVGCKNAAAAYVCTYVCKNEPDTLKKTLSSTIKKLPSTASARKKLSKIGNILLTHRLISAQESAYRLLNIPMVSSSRDTVFINTNIPAKQYKILKPKKQLEQLPGDSTAIFAQSMHDIYQSRPIDPNFELMCLAHFATHYVLLKSSEKVHVQRSKLKRYKLLSQPSQYIREKQKPSCFRSYIPNMNKDSEGHFHALLCLFLPWRTHEHIKAPYETYQDAYVNKQNLLQHDAIQQFQYTEKLKEAVQHIQRLQQSAQEDILCPVTPAYMASQLEADMNTAEFINSAFVLKNLEDCEDNVDMPKTHFSADEFKSLSQYIMTDEEYKNKLQACTSEQRTILNIVDESIDNGHCKPLHLFITGGAGSGKSFLLQVLREHILRKNQTMYPNVIVAAPTGVAAFNINAWTLHHLLHLDVQHKTQAPYTPLSAKKLEHMRKLFKDVSVLIIDEISMLSINTLLHIHKRLTEIRDTSCDDNTYFGNLGPVVQN